MDTVQESSVMHGNHWVERPMVNGDLRNFRNNGLSRGLDGLQKLKSDDHDTGVSDTTLFALYGIYRSIIGDEFINRHYPRGPGNPEGPGVNGLVLTVSDLFAVYNAWQISRFVKEPKRIVEIGPGFGALAGILRKLYPDSDITLVDLPEHRKILEYYLSDKDIHITDHLPDDADLVIALRCLMEMPVIEAYKYVKWAQERNVKHFYIVNRYIKQNVLKHYPFDSRWFPVISQNDYWTGQLHELFLERTEIGSDLLEAQLHCLPPYISSDGECVIWFKGACRSNLDEMNFMTKVTQSAWQVDGL